MSVDGYGMLALQGFKFVGDDQLIGGPWPCVHAAAELNTRCALLLQQPRLAVDDTPRGPRLFAQ